MEGRGTLSIGVPGVDDGKVTYLGVPLSVSGGANVSTGESVGTFEWGLELGHLGQKYGFRGSLRRGSHLGEAGGHYVVLRGGPTLMLKPLTDGESRAGVTSSLTLEAMTGLATEGDMDPLVGACLSIDFDAALSGNINIPSGRPFRCDDGSNWRARAHLGRRRSPSLGRALAAQERERIGMSYLEDGLDEHASVPAFERLAQELSAHGAPQFLVTRALSAATEEVRHAHTCFALAEGYLGRQVTVGDFPTLHGVRPRDLAQVAAECLVDGCLGEATAAEVVLARARTATEPTERGALRRIAADEHGHAQLAADIVAWSMR
ncbi:MAG TPA: ferritin-like domain-containing protein [Polyangiaceae bacterium]|nr:ferritin-like domain-containing protein [Polyangiaceae bacterium]